MMRRGRGGSEATGAVALPPLAPIRSFTAALLQGDTARDARDWAAAITHYTVAAELEPGDGGILLRLGQASSAAGDHPAAEAALRRALALDGGSADTQRELAAVLDRLDRAEEAAELREAAKRLGATATRAAATMVADPRPTEMWRELTKVAITLDENATLARAWIGGSPYPFAAYDRFRRDFPVRPPPGRLPSPAEGALAVLIDARHAAPFLIRATLRSVQDQSVRAWRAIVIAPPALLDHPVASFATTDARIAFVAAGEEAAALGEARHLVMTDAGTVLDHEALAWLVFAAERSGCGAGFSDHDHGVIDPVLGPVRADPVLHGAYDAANLREREAPALVFATREVAAAAIAAGAGGEPLRRAALAGAASQGGVPHIARLLATRLSLPLVARDGRPSADDLVPGRLAPLQVPPPARAAPEQRADRITVVIPTRDAAGLLERAIHSLRATARDAARLDIVIVDNRSALAASRQLFERLAADGIARTIAFDAPFNYSLACNLGAAASDAPAILFANNDIEMIGTDWDDVLIDALADERIGAVGARLLYSNGTVQHAGVAFGYGPGGAEHEGRDAAESDPGPDGRYVTTHAVASVTGAFLAVRRTDFEAIDGFDAEQLMIAHSDVDLCLRLRERGLAVLYCPAIEALHYEGATRGRNETRAAIGWDEGERADLIARWGGALGEDVGVNPHWRRGGQPFTALGEPSLHAIVRQIDATSRRDPWTPTRRAAQEAAMWTPAALG